MSFLWHNPPTGCECGKEHFARRLTFACFLASSTVGHTGIARSKSNHKVAVPDAPTAKAVGVSTDVFDKILSLFIDRITSCNKDYHLDTGDMPLMYAVQYSRLHIIKYLLEHGAMVNQQNQMGCTALMYASIYKGPKTVKLLLDYGAEPNIQTFKNGTTALIAAIEAENVDVVDLLIKNGAEVNMRDNLDKSPLDYVKRCRKKDKREKMVKMLIEAGVKK